MVKQLFDFACGFAILVIVSSVIYLCTSCGEDRRDYVEKCFRGCPKDTEQPIQPEVILVPLPGKDGQSCEVTKVGGGSEIRCGDSKTFVADGAKGDQGVVGDTGMDGNSGRDGLDGRDGKDGLDSDPVRTVVLCGSTSPHAEIAIKIGGSWIAYFEENGGSNRRLTELVPGARYMSTDGIQTCVFTTDDLDMML
jgi:hypothetical protein